MYKIIAIDLDGTLLNKKKEITLLNKEAICHAKEKGVKIVIATGRPYKGIKNIIDELELDNSDTYVICFNGGIIYHLLTNEIIYSSCINGNMLKKLYEESLKLNVNIHAFKNNQELIAPKKSEFTDLEANLNNINVEYIDFNKINDEDLFIKGMLIDPKDIIDSIIPMVDKYFYDNLSVVRSAPVFLEFLNVNAQKGIALSFLSKYLNIDICDTIAIGDAGNDLSMIKMAGIGVAMQNASDEIKENATFITSSNEESGVGKAIYKLIKKD